MTQEKPTIANEMYQQDNFYMLVTKKELQNIALKTHMQMVYKGNIVHLAYVEFVPGIYKVYKDLPPK